MNLWGDKRYHTWNFDLRKQFGGKVFKVPLDAGFTCPNRDGTVAFGGCTFCSARGSGDFAGSRRRNLVQQFEDVRGTLHKKWPKAKYIAYFQAFSNTYAPVEELREMYEAVLALPDVIGISIATRPDCLPGDVLDLLAELHTRTFLIVELGLQTVHEQTSKRINRAHDTPTFLAGLFELKKRGIQTCTHMIYGLPGETDEMMMQTAEIVAMLPTEGVKLHLLHVLHGTPLANEYIEGKFELLTKERYIQLICDTLEILPPAMAIHRLTGDGPPETLLGPFWSRKKWEVLNGIDEELKRRDSWQGKFYNGICRDHPKDWGDVDFHAVQASIGGGLRAKYPVFVPHGVAHRFQNAMKGDLT
ncbi:TIGR01212 family radical SAM protein [Fodinisporobacter ferrooxydans]|uniref:TIGR01212 family radical SAM protein n=1 Tax=Fodinisporobacter ferrooxydans TaxID=2901836 RepID=A0ABY4CPK0_9BACL|nr:TIGR01212 family radical SAM protein [Alicyclobacillaceae bacterium MYW30-H2]